MCQPNNKKDIKENQKESKAGVSKTWQKNKGENIDKRMVANGPFSPCEVTMRRQPCGNQEAGLTRHQVCRCLDRELKREIIAKE